MGGILEGFDENPRIRGLSRKSSNSRIGPRILQKNFLEGFEDFFRKIVEKFADSGTNLRIGQQIFEFDEKPRIRFFFQRYFLEGFSRSHPSPMFLSSDPPPSGKILEESLNSKIFFEFEDFAKIFRKSSNLAICPWNNDEI